MSEIVLLADLSSLVLVVVDVDLFVHAFWQKGFSVQIGLLVCLTEKEMKNSALLSKTQGNLHSQLQRQCREQNYQLHSLAETQSLAHREHYYQSPSSRETRNSGTHARGPRNLA